MSSSTAAGVGFVGGVAAGVVASLLYRQRSKFLRLIRSYPKYTSTRGYAGEDGKGLNFEQAVLAGLSPDGGLFIPEFFPSISEEELDSWYGLPFQDLAFNIFSMYIPRDQISAGDLRTIINKSYSTFRHEQVTPIIRTGPEGKGPKILELFHGPTFAFKDVALQFLGNLFEHFIGKRGKQITVVGATSGDTGSSAIYGLRGKKGVDVFILFPEGRVSAIQEKQMTTVLDENVHCIAVEGSFDDAQAIVKSMFTDAKARKDLNLGAVNSINWARVLAQITYFVYSYLQVIPKRTDTSLPRQKISFSVPTGNFGDILAGYYAKKMGLPVSVLVPATNDNKIVHEFFATGKYFKPQGVTATLAPSMDICVSSNLERFIYDMVGDSVELKKLMDDFAKTGKLQFTGELLKKAQAEMTSMYVTESEVVETIKANYEEHGYLLDPHSAIGVGAINKLGDKLDSNTPIVSLACAHWGKFTPAVGKAIGEAKLAEAPFPPELEALKTKETRKTILPATVDSVQSHVYKTLGK